MMGRRRQRIPEDVNARQLGNVVLHLRIAMGWTQDELARASKLSRERISYIEIAAEGRELKVVELRAITKALDKAEGMPGLLAALAAPEQKRFTWLLATYWRK